MKKWNKLGVGLAAVMLAVAAAGGAWAMWGGDDGGSSGSTRQESTDDGSGGGDGVDSACLAGAEDCQDDPSQGGAAGSTCLVGAADCQDNPGVSGGGMAMCVQDHPDCNDMIIGEGGDCAQDQVCTEPDVACDGDGCSRIGCALVDPAEGEPTLTPEEQERALKACEDNPPAPCDDTPGSSERCLPPDCSISSDGELACTSTEPGDGSGQSEPGSAGSEPNEGSGSSGAVDPVAPAAGQ
jgi:hypothetical protein